MFTLEKRSAAGRLGTLHTAHGPVQTPVFMPVATVGAMKGVTFEDVRGLGAQIVLGNTYHLHIQPGEEVVRKAGGLHTFMGWDKAILTDSGGFQVFSLAGIRKIEEDGVRFASHRDGSMLYIAPEDSMRIQHALGSDVLMCFDECPPSTAARADIEKAVERTLRWAKRCKDFHVQSGSKAMLFGIVQGGLERDLREKCAAELMAIGFDGYALGGLAVGESEEEMYAVVRDIAPLLPEDKPRYLMGVGERNQLQTCIAAGIDMFDCVLPTRNARHGKIFLSDGTNIRMQAAPYKEDFSPLDSGSTAPLSRTLSKAYVHHLFRANERYAETIACLQNLAVTFAAVEEQRKRIKNYE